MGDIIIPYFSQADFTASAVLQAIRSETPRLHGLRLAPAANSACVRNTDYSLCSADCLILDRIMLISSDVTVHSPPIFWKIRAPTAQQSHSNLIR
jgi:hypothetical protein